jgi:hypothetical protein
MPNGLLLCLANFGDDPGRLGQAGLEVVDGILGVLLI